MRVEELHAEYHRTPILGSGEARPRLSWITVTDTPSWTQAAYEVEVNGVSCGRVESTDQVHVPWPGESLGSRARAAVRVRTWGTDDSESSWSSLLHLETGLLDPTDWVASWITPVTLDPADVSAPAPFLRRSFAAKDRPVRSARLYVTSAGVNRVHLNGTAIGDHVLSPGWSSYSHRLRYITHDVTDLVRSGDNVIGAVLADGWWRGHLGWNMDRNVYGDRLGLLAQLEITYDDGSVEIVGTDDQWRTATGPILASDIYNGETYDARRELVGWDRPGYDDSDWGPTQVFEPKVGALVAPPGPPIRRTQELAVRELITTPSGRTLLDFGQNLVGRLRITVDGPAGVELTLRHAEVLEHGELGVRPLRNAKATDRYILRGGGETWEPEFTFHGFRYAEIEGWPGTFDPACVTAVVIHSDMERLGTFECNDELLNRLHSNAVWGMRGNFVDVPTDCPQRDERLGWTGDLQVFAPTASYLYDVRGVVANWLADLRAEQKPTGTVPIVVPETPGLFLTHTGGWSDAVTVVPTALHTAYDDHGLLAEMLPAMRAWVDYVEREASPNRLWNTWIQLGDWLDPNAPADAPMMGRTDSKLIATAYFAHSAQLTSDVAAALGQPDVSARYGTLAAEIREAFRQEYLTPKGRIMSDTATAYSIALEFCLIEDLAERTRVGDNLSAVVAEWRYTITTGFLGTPVALPALTHHGDTVSAYRQITQRRRPSWLYSVLLGATTMWERWDSLLPDGSVNKGTMTSFNHYAFGCVADWMHHTIGGLAPSTPGYRRFRVAPVPGYGVHSATARLRTPYGPASTSWNLTGNHIDLTVVVPPNAQALVVRPGVESDTSTPLTIGSGTHHWSYDVEPSIVDRWRDEGWNPGP